MHDIIIIGAGTAGLSAAIYGARSGRSVLILEQKNYGGQIVNTQEIENYPGIKHISGYEFAKSLYEQAISLGAVIEYKRAGMLIQDNEMFRVITPDKEYQCRSVIIATGVTKRPLGVEGERQLTGYGVSYCATCDGAFYKGKDVCVAGGGNTAIQSALYLSDYCRNVTLIHRRDSFRGEERLAEHLKDRANIKLYLNSNIIRLNEAPGTGKHGQAHLQSVVVKDKLSGNTSTIEAAGLFIAVGQMPDNSQFSDIIQLDQSGYIIAGEDCRTSIPGIYTAGDCRTKTIRQLTTAAADGTVSAISVCEYLTLRSAD